jgi:hypothetical protein
VFTETGPGAKKGAKKKPRECMALGLLEVCFLISKQNIVITDYRKKVCHSRSRPLNFTRCLQESGLSPYLFKLITSDNNSSVVVIVLALAWNARWF